MPSKSKFRKKRHSKKNMTKKRKGGYGEERGFPECTILSQFQVTDQNIANFSRHFSSPKDCFINALQLYGVIDNRCADLMRISISGRSGFTKEEIEIIYIYLTGYNFDFKQTNNYNEFANEVDSKILTGNAVFAGYEDLNGESHVFIIAKTSDNRIVYIDPQVPTICYVTECQDLYLKNNKKWFLLFNSSIKLNQEQTQYIINIIPILKRS